MSSTTVKSIEKKELAEILNKDEQNQKLLVLEFVSPGNEMCRFMKPELEEIASSFAPQAEFYELDYSKFKLFAQKLKVEALPTFLLMRKRKVLDVLATVKKKELESSIEKHLRISGSSDESAAGVEDMVPLSMPPIPEITVPRSKYLGHVVTLPRFQQWPRGLPYRRWWSPG